MTQITGGRICYGRTVQPAQYESKKAEVELTFVVDEGASEEVVKQAIDAVAAAAEAKCLEMVGAAPAKPQRASSSKATKEAAAASMNAKDAEKAPTSKPAKGNGAAKGDLDLGDDAPQITKNPEARTDPAQAEAPDPDLDLGATETEQPVTDKELLDAVTKKNAAISNPKAIKALRAKFTQGQSVKDIEPAKRREFLAELDKLAA